MGVWQRALMCGLAGILLCAWRAEAAQQSLEPVVPNDNTRPAGIGADGVVSIRLRAAAGSWQPEGPDGPRLQIEALGTEGAALSVPGPLIRVAEGTTLAVSIRNELASPLRVHGMCTRDGRPCEPIDVPGGAIREVRFAAGQPGTYHYWATSIGAPMPFRELSGALIVDPAGAPVRDRIFVITEWTSLTPSQLGEIMSADNSSQVFVRMRPKLTFVINGLSWPATERLTYRRDERVRWRVINLSSQSHPMHLHGFYFTVTHLGDGRVEQPVAGGAGRQVVTQVLPSGGTLKMDWVPEREGNWLFHCHIMSHVSPDRRLGAKGGFADPHAGHDAGHHDAHGDTSPDPSLGMAGMVLGITVLPSDGARTAVDSPTRAPRRVTMTIQQGPDGGRGAPPIGFAISEAGAAPANRISSPGPVVVLRRGEPVEINVVNRLSSATSMHWHGLEIESYFDGVHGWSGIGQQTAPMIAPGTSFVVRITPPRTGTFIYHTHLHDYRQLSAGLYGPLVVIDPDERFDPDTDHIIVLGRRDATEASAPLEDPASVVVNGEPSPVLTWKAGVRNRIRVINITPDDSFAVSLMARDAAASWTPLTKDGAPVPEAEAVAGPAKVRASVGETYDFEYDAPAGRTTLWLEVRSPGGRWQAQARVLVK